MSTPPELDGFTDFLDNDRLKETFSSGSLDFDEWTLLISEIETSFPDDIEKLCFVYDAFLLGNFEAAVTTYREALKKTLIGKEHLETTTLLYVQFPRLKYMITNNANEAAQILIEGNEKVPHCKLLLEELIRLLMMHGGSRQVDLLDHIIDKEISHQADSSDGLSAEDKEEISNIYMEFIDLSGTIHDVRKALVRHIKLFPHSARAKLHVSHPLGKSFRELIQRRERTRECLDQDLSTEKGIDSTVVSPPKETKEQPLDCDGSQSNLSLASGLQVEENNNVTERENLCESQSNLSMGLKTNEGGERSHGVSLPIQATPNHGFVTKQAHFSCNPVDTVKSDAIVISFGVVGEDDLFEGGCFWAWTGLSPEQ